MKIDNKNGDLVIACGILKKEINMIMEINKWKNNTIFLDSSLHVNFEKLSDTLTNCLTKYSDFRKLLVYGTCHPNMDEIISNTETTRIPVQNCVELIVGKETFNSELANGAFFLFEEWAIRWKEICYKFSKDIKLTREIYKSSHKYIHCIKTPCSNNYEIYAENMSKELDLPIIWKEYDLKNLENKMKPFFIEGKIEHEL
jgi:hypothetical protein